VTVLTAVDPGDVYVGVAFFEPEDNEWGWRCVDVQEFSPDDFIDAYSESVFANEVPITVFERFRLYNDLAVKQTGSEMPTAQLIGQMKFVVRRHNAHCDLHTVALRRGAMTTCELRGSSCMDKDIGWQPTLMVGQMADIQKPTTGILKNRGIKSVARPKMRSDYGGRDHVLSAELHGWYYLLEGSVSGKGVTTYYGD
jgi:hypothetical protein